MGRSAKVGRTLSICPKVGAAGVIAVQRIDMRGAGPGSAWIVFKSCLGRERALSSQTFRHDVLEGCESPS